MERIVKLIIFARRPLCIIAFIYLGFITSFSQEADKVPTDFTFSIEKTDSVTYLKYKLEKIYIFLDEKYFNRKNLEKLFANLSKTYSDQPISVTVFSDKEMLLKQIEWDKMGYSHLDPDTPAGKEIYNKYAPAVKGYFQAFYSKNSLTEYYYYSPQKNEADLLTVIIKVSKNQGQ